MLLGSFHIDCHNVVSFFQIFIKKDNSNVGYIYEIIPAGKIVEAVILEPPEIATNPICIENAKMNGLNLIDSLEEFHKK